MCVSDLVSEELDRKRETESGRERGRLADKERITPNERL